MASQLVQFVNCRLLRDHALVKDDLWVRDGRIENPEHLFFDEKVSADLRVDCKGAIIAPGFIDLQINGTCRLISRPLADWLLVFFTGRWIRHRLFARRRRQVGGRGGRSGQGCPRPRGHVLLPHAGHLARIRLPQRAA